MVRYIGRRLLQTVLIALAIIYFTFLGMHMIDAWEGEDPGYHLVDNARLAAVDSFDFIQALLLGELQEVPTASGVRPLDEIVVYSYRNSMVLLLLSLVGAALISVVVGSLAALTKVRGWQYTLLTGSIIGISAPSFLIAVLLQQAGIKYTLTMGEQLVSMGGFAWDFNHMAMPLLVLAARPVAYLTRSAYLGLGRIMEADYIRTAFAKGFSVSRTVVFHALRNLAVPFLTAVGVSFRFSLSVLPVVEYIFAWPGIGLRILEGIKEGLPLLVVIIALLIGMTIQVVSILLDISYYIIDPRIRNA